MHKSLWFALSAVLGCTLIAGCGKPTEGKAGPVDKQQAQVKVAFVTNNTGPFWKLAHAGIAKAEKEFNATCEFREPATGKTAEQQEIVETLIATKVTGMAISPIDPKNQTEMLNKAAQSLHVMCMDSDAPESKRMCYVGSDNYKAGVAAGKLIKEVLPNGGKVMLFVGDLGPENARSRRQGIFDAIAGKKIDAPIKSNIQIGNITIVDTLTDLTDPARAKQNPEDTLARHPDIGCLVGLWEYNGPAILSAVQGHPGRKVPIVCFDENPMTLQGIASGEIYGTVVQNPYMFGYESVRILAALARDDKSVLPKGGVEIIPERIIKKDNVEQFRKTLADQLAAK